MVKDVIAKSRRNQGQDALWAKQIGERKMSGVIATANVKKDIINPANETATRTCPRHPENPQMHYYRKGKRV